MNEVSKCEICKYWRKDPPGRNGICHRWPMCAVSGIIGEEALYTKTPYNYWCGEYRKEEINEIYNDEETTSEKPKRGRKTSRNDK